MLGGVNQVGPQPERTPRHQPHAMPSAHAGHPLHTRAPRLHGHAHRFAFVDGAGPRAPPAATHLPLQAHEHVGQVLHLEVHQREQRRADCKDRGSGQGGARWPSGQLLRTPGASVLRPAREPRACPEGWPHHPQGLVPVLPSAAEPPQADPRLTASLSLLQVTVSLSWPHPVHPNKCSNPLGLWTALT